MSWFFSMKFRDISHLCLKILLFRNFSEFLQKFSKFFFFSKSLIFFLRYRLWFVYAPTLFLESSYAQSNHLIKGSWLRRQPICTYYEVYDRVIRILIEKSYIAYDASKVLLWVQKCRRYTCTDGAIITLYELKWYIMGIFFF